MFESCLSLVSSQLPRVALLGVAGLPLSPSASASAWTVRSLLDEDWQAHCAGSGCTLLHGDTSSLLFAILLAERFGGEFAASSPLEFRRCMTS
jgi:hypothetical protein